MAEYDISCRELAEITTDYLEGGMPSPLRTTFEQHLGVCDDCVAHFDQVRATVAVLRSLPARAPSAAALDAVVASARPVGG